MRLVKPRKPQLLGEGKHAKLGCASSHAVTGGWRAGMPFSVKVYHKTKQHLIPVTEETTFGQLKDVMAKVTGVQPSEMKLWFRSRECGDDKTMGGVGVKPGAKILLVECENFRKRRADEMDAERQEAQRRAAEAERQQRAAEAEAQKRANELQLREAERRAKEEEGRKSLQAVADVGQEVDDLAGEVDEMAASVSNGEGPNEKRSRVINELLTQKLLKLDTIQGDEEIRKSRKAQIKRIEDLTERLEGLGRKASPDSSMAVTVIDKRSA